MSQNFVIFDCDGGSDDAWALLFLLKAEEEKRLSILGVTICGGGNTSLHNAARNMLRILKASGRDEIPIFLGASGPLIPISEQENEARHSYHGKDGFGDVLPIDVDIDIEEMVEGEHAVSAINQFCIENPQQVTVIAVGPLTNIALCYSMYGQEFANNVKQTFIMGGNFQGIGNATRAAEFNFHCDPEAAHIVLAKAKSNITILPWEACMDERFFLCIKWRFDVFGPEAEQLSPAVQLLNEVDRAQRTLHDSKCWNPCDAILVAAFIFGNHFIRKTSKWHATVDLSGSHTRGQMVLDHLHEEKKYPKNVCIIELADAEIFKHIARWSTGVANVKDIIANGEVNSNEEQTIACTE